MKALLIGTHESTKIVTQGYVCKVYEITVMWNFVGTTQKYTPVRASVLRKLEKRANK